MEKATVRGLPSLARTSSSRLTVKACVGKKIKTEKPYGLGSKPDPKTEVQWASLTGPTAGFSDHMIKLTVSPCGFLFHYLDYVNERKPESYPIYNPDEWSPSGDVYVGGTTGLAIWAVTLAGLLAGGALLVYNKSALAQ
ncbi:hypothetical protein RND71_037040 [Anisodus tanguticus]|uniref:Photosystem II 10 kDa polypeptide, chloroplastic n=1 Tax=Anisodus tanguticus TaxID=243964 RepID=A0AAE1UYG8_9SOLA|nr:hypothetical protein RND71_037040 [Anisodus tanguticus]